MKSPSIASGVDRERAIKHILDIIKTYDLSRVKPVNDARKRLDTYSDSTIDLIIQESRSPNHRINLVMAAVIDTDENTVREVMHLHPHCTSEMAPVQSREHELIGIIRGLHQLDQFKNTGSLDALSGNDLKIAAAFINITSAIHQHFEQSHLQTVNVGDPATASIHISNPTAQQLITEHHHYLAALDGFFTENRFSSVSETFSGLPHLRWYQHQTLQSITGDTIKHAISYLRVTSTLHSHTEYEHLARSGDWKYSGMHINNTAFESIIDQNYQKADSIIDYIKERNSADPDGIRDYLADGSALNVGVL